MKKKLQKVPPIKPKWGEVFILKWGSESKSDDYIADQYVSVADTTQMVSHSGIQLVKKYYNICDYDSVVAHKKKLAHSKEFQKTMLY